MSINAPYLVMAERRAVDRLRTSIRDAGLVHQWRTNGVVVASAYRHGQTYWVSLRNVGWFRFESASCRVEALPDAGASERLVRDSFRRAIVPFVLQVAGWGVLHASAVELATGVVALCGPSGVGKSTLARALSLRGHELCADDVVALRAGTDGIVMLDLPFELRLLPDARQVLGTGDAPHGRCSADGDARLRTLAAVCLLSPRTGDQANTVAVQRLPPGDALAGLLANAYALEAADSTRRASIVRPFLAVVAQKPVLRVAYPKDLSQVPAIACAIEAAV